MAGQYNKIQKYLLNIDIIISYDMRWQKRAGGIIYDSLSGHGLFIGCQTKNIVVFEVIKKKISMCDVLDVTGVQREHKCNVNWNSLSGSTESSLALKLTKTNTTGMKVDYT